MSSITNITVYDGAATPVLHTLLPVSVTRDNGKVIAFFRENAASVPLIAQVTAELTLSKTKSGVYKVESRCVVPVMEAVGAQNAAGYTAAPKVAYENTVITTGFFHERSDTVGRRLVRQLSTNIMGSVSTSVAPVTSGPLPDLFDLLVAPT